MAKRQAETTGQIQRASDVYEFPTVGDVKAIQAFPPDKYLAVGGNAEDLKDTILVNSGGAGMTEFDLDRVVMPGSGGLAWNVPSPEGILPASELVGVIIGQGQRRAYWSKPFGDGSNTPPDCSSFDGVVGHGTIASEHGGRCMTCPMAVFGTKPDPKKQGAFRNAQACQARLLLFMMQPGRTLPLVVSLSPANIGVFRKFAIQLASINVPLYSTVISLGLKQERSQDGIVYSEVVPREVVREDKKPARMPRDVAAKFAALGKALQPVLGSVGVTAVDFAETVEVGVNGQKPSQPA